MYNDSEIQQLAADSRLTGYLAVAALCILIYDHIVCIPEEAELMWKSRWGIAKVIYLWNRYFSAIVISLNPFSKISALHSCIGWLQVQSSSSIVLIATVDFVLMLRVWILYGRPRWMVWFFAFLAISEVVVMISVDVLTFQQMRAGRWSLSPEYVHLGSIIKGCYAYNVPRYLTLYIAAPLIVTCIMFTMTVYKCAVTLRGADRSVMPLWKLFLRDGVVWFVLVFATAGSGVFIWTTGRETLNQVLIIPALVVYSGVSSRALLNIKQIMAAEPPEMDSEEGKCVTAEVSMRNRNRQVLYRHEDAAQSGPIIDISA
ncbi:hypothetical protein DFH06DRAFT_615559 [Mycena polygramma]|nr:hypothetical protein DFH06DRAFT_615559 [Mycena polygramma]